MTPVGGRTGPHVLVIVQNMSVPLDRRVWLECQSLVAAGYRVSVICPRGSGDSSFAEIDGVRIHRYRCAPVARGVLGYGLEFAWCWLLAARLAWRIHRRDRIDVIQGCNPPDTYWLLALLFRRAGVRFVFDHHDLCPELYRSKPGHASPVVLRLLEWLERRTFGTADLVLTTNESYRDRACERTGYRPDDVVVVRSGPDPDTMRRGAEDPALRNGRQHLVAYLGLMNPQDGVDVVLDVAEAVVHGMHRDDVQFALLGYGDCLDDLRERTRLLGLEDHVTFTGRAELDAISAYLSTAVVGLSPDPHTPFNDVSTMNKTLEYMAFELPIVAFDLHETVVSAGPAAVYVTPIGDRAADARNLTNALVALIDDPERRARLGAAGRQRIESGLGWPASAAKYVAAYDELTGQRKVQPMTTFDTDVVIIGGCGHVGLPLGLAFADRGLHVTLYDINPDAVAQVNAGILPADEPGAQAVLDRVCGTTLTASTNPAVISSAEFVIVVIGTPVGAHLAPDPQAVPRAVEELHEYFREGQLLVLRSTVYPGVTAQVERLVDRVIMGVDVAFCPERIAEGKAMTELFTLPQLVAARKPDALARASSLFSHLAPKVVELSPEEAELAKLFTNVYRYIKFAAANQLFMMANDVGCDYERIRAAVVEDYPRAADLPGAGFAAGPCLLKDTMQLAAFDDNRFTLGHASMAINEGLPLYLVSQLEKQHHLEFMTVGILGMAFKGESDDVRSSLAYKLKRVLSFKTHEVLTTDPYVPRDPDLLPMEEVVERADLLIIAAPHAIYRELQTETPIVDIWNLRGLGTRI